MLLCLAAVKENKGFSSKIFMWNKTV